MVDKLLKLNEFGVDAIIGTHPHVIQTVEWIENPENGHKTIVCYSLGNFIFDTDYQRAQFNTEFGLLIKLNFTEDSFDFEPMGLEILRGPEKVVKANLPRIFTDVQEDDYKLLVPLSAKVLVEATKRQQKYLNPKEFENATEEKWQEHFMQPMRTGRVPGETLDFHIICPLADEAEKGEWKKSALDEVKDFMLEQI